MRKAHPLLFWLALAPCCLGAQDLTQHQGFFEAQALEYQEWLGRTALSEVLAVHEVQVMAEGVALNLRLVAADPDSLSAKWEGAKGAFAAQNRLELEEALFLKMLRLFDLQSRQAFLQIKPHYRAVGSPYYIKAFTEDGVFKTLQSLPKGFFDKVEIGLQLPDKPNSQAVVGAGSKAGTFYELVRQFIEAEYGPPRGCEGQAPRVDAFYSTDGKLLVNVSGLCGEVLRADELLFCSILRRLQVDCETVKRESLSFEFDYDTQSGRLYCQLDGKYSNDYLFYQGSPQDMDNDPGFEELLKAHGEAFLKKLKLWIEQR